MPDLETEREATERIADHTEQRKKKSMMKMVVIMKEIIIDKNRSKGFGSVFINNINNLNNQISNIKSNGEYYSRLIANQNAVINKYKKDLTDRKN